MKIWFDLSNSPHINMFHDLIRDLESHGHSIIITSRPLANTIELLNQRGMQHTIVGEHYGKNILRKVFGYPIRIIQLRKFLQKHRPDLAVSQSSFHSPIVAKLLKIPSIYTNDNEHALGNIPCFLCATKILIPENLSLKNIAINGFSLKKVTQYPGLKEGVYLWSKGEQIQKDRMRNHRNSIKIYIRPEPQTAQYYNGRQNFLDNTILELQNTYQIIVLPRDFTQATHYKQAIFSNVVVPDKPLSFTSIASDCSLFIGAGGSMTRELAILGIPTISVYQGELLDVDKFLIAKDLMLHSTELTANEVTNYIGSLEDRPPAQELMVKGKQAYNLFKEEILKFDRQ